MTVLESPAPAAPAPRRSFLRDGLSVLGTKAVIIPVGLATSVLTARFLGVEDKGALTALTAVPYLVVTLAEGGVRQSAVYLLGQRRYPGRAVAGTTYWLLAISAAVGLALGALGYTLQGRSLLDVGVLLALSLIPIKLCKSYASGLLLGQNRVPAYNRVNRVPTLLTLAAVLVLLGWLRLGLEAAVATLVVGALPVAAYVTWLVWRDPGLDLRFSPPIAGELARRGVVYALALFVIQLNYRVDYLLLERWSSAEQLGQYSVGVNLAELILELPLAFGVIVFARRAHAGDSEVFGRKVAQVVRSSLLLVTLAAIGLALTADLLLPLFYGEDFAESAQVTRLLLPGVIVLTAFKILNLDLAGRGRPHVALGAMIGGLTVNVALNSVLIPAYGAQGAAVASSASYSVATAAFVIAYGRLSGLPVRSLVAFSRDDLRQVLRAVPARLRPRGR